MYSIIGLFVSIFFIRWICPDAIVLTDALKATGIGTALSSVAATMLGFMLAALSILASISGLDFVKNLMSSGHYQDLLRNLFIGCLEILILLIMSLVLLFGSTFGSYATTFYLSLLIACLILLVELGFKFWMLLKSITAN